MKAIFVFTAALMAGASIYGVASYKKLSGTKDFKELYAAKKDVKHKEPVLIEKKTKSKVAVIAETKELKKTTTVRKKAKRKSAYTNKQEVKSEPLKVEFANEATMEDLNKTSEPAKKVKKLNRKMFSRAALRDE